MPRFYWDEVGTRFYEAGVERGVLYPLDGEAAVWNGLISVKQTDASSITPSYFEGHKIRNDQLIESFSATVDAFTYPDCIEDAFLAPWKRHIFNFTYRTEHRNDLGVEGYMLHLVYNAQFKPTQKNFDSVNSSADIDSFSWGLSTTPIFIPGIGPTAHLIVDSTKALAPRMNALENALYGTPDTDPYFPNWDELYEMFEENSVLRITDHGDGTWTAEGPDDVVKMLDATTFEINWPSAIYLNATTYTVSTF